MLTQVRTLTPQLIQKNKGETMEFLWLLFCIVVGVVAFLYITVFVVVFLVGRIPEMIAERFKIESILHAVKSGWWSLVYTETQFSKPLCDEITGQPISTNTLGGVIDTLVREGYVVRTPLPHQNDPALNRWRINRPPRL